MSNAVSKRVRAWLFAHADVSYRNFQSALLANLPQETVIGVRTPLLRAYAKELTASADAQIFCAELPHGYYEENNLHGFCMEHLRNREDALCALERFLPYVDNWATCDLLHIRSFDRDPMWILPKAEQYLHASHAFTVRFGIGLLMRYFAEDRFDHAYPDAVIASLAPYPASALTAVAKGIVSKQTYDAYYVHMMAAWYFATLLAKQETAILPYFTERRLPPETHRRAIRKALESYRVSEECKACLRTML